MTPMVDLAFLLVTFFMLTTKFRAQEPVTVDIPSSTSEITVPEKNLIVLTVSKEGGVFFDLQNQQYRKDLLERMGKDYNIQFSEQELATFSNLGSFGIPMNQMRQYLNLPTEQRDKVQQPGIPVDSAHNELEKWVLNARLVDRAMPLAIKGDKDTHFEIMKKVINTIQDKPKVTRFSLITSLEAAPEGMTKKK
jgi:biopolymer transport protein ExbD